MAVTTYARRNDYREADILAVRWMVEALDATEAEIAYTLGISQRRVKQILAQLGRQEREV